MSGILFGDKHTERDWGLLWTTTYISPPELQKYEIKIPGRDGVLDLSTALTGGEERYYNRTLQFGFMDADNSNVKWHGRYSDILDYCHGRKMKIILDVDDNFYYEGKVTVEAVKEQKLTTNYLFACDVEPYKYEVQTSDEDWLWDPFSFETGIIRSYNAISVSGTHTITIPNRRKPVVPTIKTSTAMTVDFQGKTYSLKAGDNVVSEIRLKEGDNVLMFKGNGTITIIFRGGSL